MPESESRLEWVEIRDYYHRAQFEDYEFVVLHFSHDDPEYWKLLVYEGLFTTHVNQRYDDKEEAQGGAETWLASKECFR